MTLEKEFSSQNTTEEDLEALKIGIQVAVFDKFLNKLQNWNRNGFYRYPLKICNIL